MAEGINAPLLFFLEEKTVSLRGKRSPLRRTSSFLFRRKEAKENHLRNSCFSALLPLSPCATQNGRFTYEPSVFPFRAGRVKEHLFSDKSTIPLCLLFLFFKKRKRSPFFSALLLLSPCATQNGRFTYEPSVFPFRAGRVKEHLFSDKSTIPLCLLFLFFKKRKRSPFFSALLLLSPCATQNGRFTYEPSVFPFQVGHAGNRLFSEKHPPPLCLLFLFFKKRNRTPSF